MITRETPHQALMRDVLRDVYTFGAARLPQYLLYRWFGATKIGKNTWRRISEMWEEVLEEHEDKQAWRIATLDTGRGDEITFFCMDPEDASESYIKPLSERC